MKPEFSSPPRCKVGGMFTNHELGREPINLPVGRLARVRYAPMATEFRSTAK
jgi:hypothetical protein